ncbi:MAG: hypothetical protein BZ135_04115 [Methanosphaera sp. rholeuAM6]|nr:MAG: hypothetical protein BZ135_04115 [Methanosphaera sp. rholeuAM6]
MNEEIVMLSHYLRNEGMTVSIRSTMLADMVLESMRDIMTYDELRNSLKAVYVKNLADNVRFERAFMKVFGKIELKPDNNNEIQVSDEIVSGESGEIINNYVPNENLEELQELYDEMIKVRSDTKAKEGKVIDGSLILLDNFDPRIFELCRKLSKKIANKRSSRRKKSKSHHLDMARTIRANIKNGGHCIKLIYDKPPLKKTKHVFLCDVSGSCEWVTTWFFVLLYGCKSTFNKVKIYDFDNKVADVTDLLDVESYTSAGQINVAHRSKGVSCYGQSDMYKSFKEFMKMADINKRTDIIILTDCRDWKGERVDGVLKSATVLKSIVQKARQVIILNPEKKIRWNNTTSCVKDYERVGARVFETSSLEQFEKVIGEL